MKQFFRQNKCLKNIKKHTKTIGVQRLIIHVTVLRYQYRTFGSAVQISGQIFNSAAAHNQINGSIQTESFVSG